MRYTTVMEYLNRYISERSLKAGDKLPTEKELAETLNVSRITVRRAYQELLSAGTIERVQGSGTFYTGKQEEKSSSEVSFYVPLVLIGSQGYHSVEIIRGADQYLGRHDCYLSVRCSQQDPVQEQQCIRQLVDNGSTCIMVYPCSSNENAEFYYDLMQQGIRFIFLDRLPQNIPASLVTCDNFSGGYLAAQHLIECGCRHPMMISVNPLTLADTLSQRKAGFEFLLSGRNLSGTSDCFHFIEPDRLPAALKQLLNQPVPPDGIFCANDITAKETVRYLDAEGICYPEQLALISFDDTPFAAGHTTPLSEISQSFFQQGYEAARMAYHILNGKSPAVAQLHLPVSLVVRKSSETVQWLAKY